MKRGLIDVVMIVPPQAEHKWCARHIFSNWNKKWTDGELMKKLQIYVWSTYKEEFKDNLEKLGEVS